VITAIELPTRPAAAATDDDPPELADVAALMRALVRAHADGVLRTAALEHLADPGKQLRARLAFETGAALGAARAALVPWAAACELLHNASLVHDDLQDRDAVRRGRPTVWVRHGDAAAVNVGDLLMMLPHLALRELRCDPAVCWRLCVLLVTRAVGTVNGQSADLERPDRGAAGWDGYEAVARGKTGHFFALPVAGAAIAAGRDEDEADAVGDAFADVGVAFQMANDLADLSGRTPRRRGSDVRRGALTALVVEHLRREPGDLGRWPDAAEVDAVAARFRASGAAAGVLGRMEEVRQRFLGHPGVSRHPALQRSGDALLRRILAAAAADVAAIDAGPG